MRLSLTLFSVFLPLASFAQGDLRTLPEETSRLFTKGLDIGTVGDRPGGSPRRLVQRTVMPGEPLPPCGAVLTFDDQLVPASPDHSSAMDIVQDLRPHKTRAIFFANIPKVSSHSLRPIINGTSDRAEQKRRCLSLLEQHKPAFMKAVEELLIIKEGDTYLCEVYNHTAFHQDMRRMKVGSARYDLCVLGIEFIEQCLDEAYAKSRPNFERTRYFRFPFLHVPKDRATRTDLNTKFIEYGLNSLGETQDSKDFTNGNPKFAYQSLVAAQNHLCYKAGMTPFGHADQPIALFHTKTWRKIRNGVLKAIIESGQGADVSVATKKIEIEAAPERNENGGYEGLPRKIEVPELPRN